MSANNDLEIEVYYDAPREEIYENWIEPSMLGTWFAPDGFDCTECEVSAHPGGKWRVVFRSKDGVECQESGEFLEVVAPERLVFTLHHVDPNVTLDTLVSVTFAVDGSGTRMTFKQSGFDSVEVREDQREGWGECFEKLRRNLATV